MINKKLILIGVAILAVAIILLIVPKLFFKKKTTTPTTTTQQTTDAQKAADEARAKADETAAAANSFPLPSVTTDTLIAQAKKEYEFAAGKAVEWRKDAIPIATKISYTKSIDPKNGKDTYIFVSPSENKYYFTLTFDQAQNDKGTNVFQRALYFKEDYFLSKTTVNMPVKYLKMNYIQALQKADESGGKSVRMDNKEYDVNMVLSAEEGKNLMWKVEYLIGAGAEYTVSYNAYTGELL